MLRLLQLASVLLAISDTVCASISPDYSCGGKSGYTCPSGYCCSEYGWCGKGSDYCSSGCQTQWGICSGGSSGSPPSNGGMKVSVDGECGDNGRTCDGYKLGSCCSKYGYCGDSNAYCGKGCQEPWGICKGSTKPSSKTTVKPISTKTSTKKTSSIKTLTKATSTKKPSSTKSYVKPTSTKSTETFKSYTKSNSKTSIAKTSSSISSSATPSDTSSSSTSSAVESTTATSSSVSSTTSETSSSTTFVSSSTSGESSSSISSETSVSATSIPSTISSGSSSSISSETSSFSTDSSTSSSISSSTTSSSAAASNTATPPTCGSIPNGDFEDNPNTAWIVVADPGLVDLHYSYSPAVSGSFVSFVQITDDEPEVSLINNISDLRETVSYTVSLYALAQNDGVRFSVYLNGALQTLTGTGLSGSFTLFTFTFMAIAPTAQLRIGVFSSSFGPPYLLFDAVSVTTPGCADIVEP